MAVLSAIAAAAAAATWQPAWVGGRGGVLSLYSEEHVRRTHCFASTLECLECLERRLKKSQRQLAQFALFLKKKKRRAQSTWDVRCTDFSGVTSRTILTNFLNKKIQKLIDFPAVIPHLVNRLIYRFVYATAKGLTARRSNWCYWLSRPCGRSNISQLPSTGP